jgi:hypothetical protein
MPVLATPQTGVDVIITIFCDIHQFSAKKNWRFYYVMIHFLYNLAVVCVKNANFFADFLGAKIF